jgi:hypothetical protein
MSDAELIRLCVASEKDAFGEIVRRYQGVVTGLIYSRCRGKISLSEDLAQETFLIAWQRQNQSIKQVAGALELSEVAVRKRLERARAMLRDEMAASIEEELGRTTPGKRFTTGVMLAVPALSGKAMAAATGEITATKVAGTSAAGSVALLIGPLIGLLGGLIGTHCTIQHTRSKRERQFAIRQSMYLWKWIVLWAGAMGTWIAIHRFIPWQYFWSGIVLLCVMHNAAIIVFAIRFNRRQRQIRVEDGTADAPPPPVAVRSDLLWNRPRHVYTVVGGAIIGGLAWMVVMAVQAGDWLWTGGLLVLAGLLIGGGSQAILRKGPMVVRRTLIILLVGVAAANFAAVNLRMHQWLAQEVESRLVFAGYRFATDNLWATNLFLAVMFGVLFLVITRKG